MIDEATATRHYAEHDGKPFFADLVSLHHPCAVGGDGGGGP